MEHARYEILIEESTPSYGRIAIEPLERGYGVTLGNALRRVLLSSINGAAITAVKIDSVYHEFMTVEGVKEDVIELLMNIKHIPVRSFSKEYRVIKLNVDPSPECRVITASYFEPDTMVEFPDPDAVICNLEANKKLSMEVYVEGGIGYAVIDRPRPSYLPVDALLVDAIFSPCKRVKYEVTDKRMGQRTDYDRLVLEVWTNGVVSPEDAIRKASVILKDYFLTIAITLANNNDTNINELYGTDNDKNTAKNESDGTSGSYSVAGSNPDYERPVRDLELSVRSENCLMRGGVHKIGELIGKSRSDLLKIRNLGKISLNEIEKQLERFNLTLSGEIDEDTEDMQD